MRNLRSLFAVLCLCVFTFANAATQDRITATITFTNQPSDGNTFTFNAVARTFKNTVATPSTQILIGSAFAGTATNMYLQIASNPYGGGVIVSQTASNVVQLLGAVGQAVVASMTGTWGTITLSTQAVTTANTIRVPFAAEPTTSVRTNNATQLVSDLSTYSTGAFSATSPALGNHVNTSETQTISGYKTFSGGIDIAGGTINQANITNSHYKLFDSEVGKISFWDSSPALSAKIYAATTTGEPLLTLWTTTPSDWTLLNRTNAAGFFGAKTLPNTWTGLNTFSLITNSVIGASTLTNNTYYGTVGVLSGGYLSSVGMNGGSLTSVTTRATLTIQSDLAYPRVNNTSLANGNNSGVSFGSETVYAKIKPGPTAAFTINGIASGRDGRCLIVENATAQAMTIAYDSGVEGTAANRIYTMTGANVVSSGNCTAVFLYDSEVSRWKLIAIDPSGGTSLASPTAVIGLTANNGSAGTAMRSDASPALSQGIAPTWTGVHTFQNSVLHLAGAHTLTLDGEIIGVSAPVDNLSSDNATASNRTFYMGPSAVLGQIVTLVWVGTNAAELIDDSNAGGPAVRLSGNWTPTQYDTLTMWYNGTDWIEVSRSTN